jgi:hypothetical protein
VVFGSEVVAVGVWWLSEDGMLWSVLWNDEELRLRGVL